MNRRGFLKFLSAATIVAVTPLKFIAPALHARMVESLSLQEIITTTLRNRMPEVAANVTRSNALLKRLSG